MSQSTAAAETAPIEDTCQQSLRLRAVLVAMGIVCVGAFYYANGRTEEFRLQFPRFLPWLWNLFLTCSIAGLVGVLAMWWCRRWGFWTLLSAGVLSCVIGLYAMGFTLIGGAVALSLAVLWKAAQQDWEKFI